VTGGGARWTAGPRLLVAALVAALGFGLAVGVNAARGPAGLATARQEDLVRILDDLEQRGQRLRQDVAALERSRDRLAGGAAEAALAEARERADTLAVLAGTVAATGPGVVVTVTDPRGEIRAEVLVSVLHELRDAGAEVIDLGGVRVVAQTAIVDADGGVRVDGRRLAPPYRFTAIGPARTLAQAMQIPGGVVDAVGAVPGARAEVDTRERVDIRSLRPVPTPR
jgi:uncharacterized protein YlxW (UPF0749 family)